MSDYIPKNPLSKLGYDWKSYYQFRDHLRLPPSYVKFIFRIHRRTLYGVLDELPKIIETIHHAAWSRMANTERTDILCKLAGVPPMFIRDDSLPLASAETLSAYSLIINNLKKLQHSGRILYFHSASETACLLAASNVIKAAIRSGIYGYMLDMPTYMSEIKTWQDSDRIKNIEGRDICCLYFVGKEYASDFNKSYITNLITKRRVQNKVTIISSHLTPAEFTERYGFESGGVPLKFEEEGLAKSIKALIKELGG